MRAAADRSRHALQGLLLRTVMQLRAQPPSLRLGLLAMLAALMVLEAGVRPWLRVQVAQATQRLAQQVVAPLPAEGVNRTTDSASPSSARAEDQLWSQLPAATTHAGDVDALVAMATRLDLPLPRAQLRRVESPASVVIEEVDLEFDAPYPVVRRYLARCLNELPHASVRRIRMERSNSASPSDAATRATVTLRLHYRVEVRP